MTVKLIKDDWAEGLINRPWTTLPNKEKKMNKWNEVCKYINRRRNGATITRKKLLEHMRQEYLREHSIDTYRNYLTKAGFLIIIGNGKYQKVKTIPRGISRRDVQRLGYDVSNYHKGW